MDVSGKEVSGMDISGAEESIGAPPIESGSAHDDAMKVDADGEDTEK